MNHFLSDFPLPSELRKKVSQLKFPDFREANGHIHTPYSFSAFSDLNTIFSMARDENIAVLGINDFFVADGYEEFYKGSLRNNIFPLFNIEFIGLLKKEQKKGIRINDPNNPGRIYFSGKGLDYPFNPGWFNRLRLQSVINESQLQIKAMIFKLNELLRSINPSLTITYDSVKNRFAHDLVRERHLAKAIRHLAAENFNSPEDQIHFIETLYGGKKSKAGLDNHAALENEIRSNLLKSGGPAFVEENERSFLELRKIVGMILKAGGIPCYPVLLDDVLGNFTEFEKDPEKLCETLSSLKTGCIELIPGRNDPEILKEHVKFFHNKGFIISFGTEHNTPEMIPLTVTARGSALIDNELKHIAWEGICIMAAHQYLRAKGRQGYVLPDGNPSISQIRELSHLGRMVIEFFLQNHREYETGNPEIA
ncbi:MAG TPA: hypothetical protein DDW27_08815 [Bacteroidales bacterium]|jgi:hypothetical protein|nr:hypothetical protein [Bacteroidales bacterium]